MKQESLFYHETVGDGIKSWKRIAFYTQARFTPGFCSAYTVAELGEMLPRSIPQGFIYSCKRLMVGWVVYCRDVNGNEKDLIDAPTEADARGKMLIHLLEQGIIKASDL